MTQKQQDAIITAQDFYEVEAEGGTLNIPVQANVDFTVSTDADWITWIEGDTKGLTDRILHFNVAPSESGEMREATITLAYNDLKRTIKVMQYKRNDTSGGIDDIPVQPW